MQKYKITTSWTTYSHYIVEALNVDDAQTKFHDGFLPCKDDPMYGDNNEEILSVTSIKIEDTQ